MKKTLLTAICLIVLFSCGNKKNNAVPSVITSPDFMTPLGKKIVLGQPPEKLLKQYNAAKADYKQNPENVDAIIWYGRRTAYLGKYNDAIGIYSEGIKKFPNDARLFRHRGHRYISLREFDKAIADFETAGLLIQGTENQIEPDGMPNAQNIPVSTLHGNIWYHLGLAYYLSHNYEKAFEAYTKCRETGNNDDNLVSSTHWLYMIQRRLANKELADLQLEPIQEGASIIENHSYYTLCKFYKGLIPIDSLQQAEIGSPSSDAVIYGLANWHFYNNEKKIAKKIMEDVVESKSWSSFGYIAAESDLIYYFDQANE